MYLSHQLFLMRLVHLFTELHVSRIPEEPNIRAIYMQFVVCCHSADILYKEWIYFVYMYLF